MATGALADRYFLTPPPRVGPVLTLAQGLALLAGLAAVAFVFTARLVEAESGARRMSLFLYLLVAALMVALAVALLVQPESLLFGGARP